MGSLYRSQQELIFVFKHGRDGYRNNVQPHAGSRLRSGRHPQRWQIPWISASKSFSRLRWGSIRARNEQNTLPRIAASME